ncbi:MAG: hypothetical protein JWM80_5817 [Cyanobacteria bacterium RYN_339]|nr:hypothetical protein [Cyanobacteria bacterium RYN_339]
MRPTPWLLLIWLAGCTPAPTPAVHVQEGPEAPAVAAAPVAATPPEPQRSLYLPQAPAVDRAPEAPPPQTACRWERVSKPGQARASSGPAIQADDDDPTTEWNPRAASPDGGPQWLAVPLEAAAKGSLALVFHGHALHYENYDYGRPRTFELQTSGDGEAWHTLRTVTDNMVRSRVELFDAPGATWVRLRFLSAWGTSADREPFLREVAVYEQRSAGAPDIWLIFGDSTTSVGLDPAAPATFAPTVAKLHPGYQPILLSGGTGGDESGNAADRLAVGLPTLPRGSVVGMCYGTNDAKKALPIPEFKRNLDAAIAQIRAAGDVPLLATLPWSLNGAIAAYAAACREVAASNGLPPGPDFYSYFKGHPDELEVDRVHPNAAGQASMQRLWAEAADFRYP